MANHKFADQTRKRILDTAYHLFLKKGWAETTIQDIIDEMGDVSRGAFYHHFKSKDDIVDAVTTRIFVENNPFEEAKRYGNLNGLEKLRKVLEISAANQEQLNNAMALVQNPLFVARQLHDCIQVLAPRMMDLLVEGNADGSMSVQYPKQAAETMSILLNIYLNPLQFDGSRDAFSDRISHVQNLLEGLGIPLIDDSIRTLYLNAYQIINNRTA